MIVIIAIVGCVLGFIFPYRLFGKNGGFCAGMVVGALPSFLVGMMIGTLGAATVTDSFHSQIAGLLFCGIGCAFGSTIMNFVSGGLGMFMFEIMKLCYEAITGNHWGHDEMTVERQGNASER